MTTPHPVVAQPAAVDQAPRSPLARLAAAALIGGQVAFIPFALWHGSLETTDGATTLATVQDAREGWYWLHYGTLACLFTIALSLISLASWAAGPRRRWAIATALLFPISLLHLAMAFGTEAVGFYYLTRPGLIASEQATVYLQEMIDGGHYGVLIGTGLLAYTLGQVAAVRVLAVRRELPQLLRRLLPVAVMLDFAKVAVASPVVAGALAVAAAAIWVWLGVSLLRILRMR